jgi:hypothetical protein
MLQHLAKITAIDPAIAGRAADEVVGLIIRLIAETFPPDICRAGGRSRVGGV